ncbi:hypothetical protein I6J71_36925 [Amycolatopsis sp. FDAARGOS 1241]|nr:hypothetical protein I6J71_36925 [Amycolatopsis sp. FDAARGOS 1241]
MAPRLQQLLDTMPDIPALVLNRRTDVLAWNHGAAALLGPGLPRQPLPRHAACGGPRVATRTYAPGGRRTRSAARAGWRRPTCTPSPARWWSTSSSSPSTPTRTNSSSPTPPSRARRRKKCCGSCCAGPPAT